MTDRAALLARLNARTIIYAGERNPFAGPMMLTEPEITTKIAQAIRELEAERDALREALHEQVVRRYFPGEVNPAQDWCILCREGWIKGNAERHAPNCLAARSKT